VTAAPDRLAAALADRYRVDRELGQGGMATVYLAEDLKHHRRVALKVLRPELAATLGPDRFFREIEVAAKLQHPHILPLHDSGEAGGFLYYVMPFVDGESLRRRLARGGELPIHDAVRILAEVADALAYAHGNGVVHRDIKPDNVLLSGRHALVSDFGVAKAVSEATGRQQLTTAGVALGTPAYMAPEQAAAEPTIDQRVDIYALGVMGYELLTGRPPFVGASSQEILAAHITQPPAPVSVRRPAVPAGLAEVIMKCLAKRPADRWQSADELFTHLEQQLTPTGGTTPSQTRPTTAVHQSRAPATRVAVIVGVVLVAAAGGLLLAHRSASGVPQLGKRSALTLDPGLELNPALSPDGKLVAYSRMTPAETRLVVQQLAGGEPVTVARWLGLHSALPSWSPDGARLAYSSPRGLEVIPALGGASRLLATQSRDPKHGWAAWAPDGNKIAYTSADTIYARDLETDTPRPLLQTESPHSPVWSPDGKWIAYVSGNPLYPGLANLAPSSIWVVRASGGPPIRITEDRPLHASPVWLPDSRGLLYVSDQDGGRDIYVVRLSRSAAPEGAPRRLTTGLYPHTISLSADGRKLVYALYGETSNVLALPLQRGRSVSLRDAKPITSGSQVIEGFAVSPDEAWLVFDSNRNGNQDIWRMPVDGSSPPEVLSAGPEDEFQPSYSPDGKWVGFHATRSGSVRDLYLIPATGGQRTRIEVATSNNVAPRISPDGRSVLYTVWSADGGFWVSAARRSAGDPGWGRTTPLFRLPSILNGAGDWSPNGKWVCYIHGSQLFRADADGQHSQVIATLPADLTPFYARWSTDGRLVYYSGINVDGTYLIYAVAPSGGRVAEVAHSEGPSYQNFRFSFEVRDTTLYVSLADRQSDIWMAEMLPK
jgi:Tol biopolymer transport system component/tRNA A-37 threonylcarbamoyl transferase component Bud32